MGEFLAMTKREKLKSLKKDGMRDWIRRFLVDGDDVLIDHFDSFDEIFEYYKQKLRGKTQSWRFLIL